MATLFKTEQLKFVEATENDIPYIMRLEQHPDNRKFVVQGTVDEHKHEIDSTDFIVFIIKERFDKIGYMLCYKDEANSSFELRRMIIQSKGKGYGKEALKGLINFVMNTLDYHRFWLDVYEDNDTGIHLYESIGMELDGILRKSYSRDGEFISQHIYSITNKEKEGRN